MLFIYFYEAEFLLTYLLLGVLVLVFSYSGLWARYLTPNLHRLFFLDALKHPMLLLDNHVRNYNEIALNKTQQELKEASG
jgi:hypothetical protein